MSFVVVIPESERETLRGGGVIPEGFFRDLDGDGKKDGRILMWPHELDYGAGTVEEGRPVDLAEFFGLGPSDSPEEKREKERLLAPVLRLPVVHIVFLDDREGPDGYAKFRSFAEAGAWAKRLQQAMETRFPRESGLAHVPRALVLVANTEQVKVSEDELTQFNECVGMGKLFTSCYYLDYNLRMGVDGDLYHAADIWDVAVGRLLLAFVLSQEKDSEGKARPYFGEPGIKLWRSADCRAGLDPVAETAAIGQALGEASKKLREHLETDLAVEVEESSPADADALKANMDKVLGPLFPAAGEKKAESWRSSPRWGWSDFKAPKCLTITRDDDRTRWHAALDGVKEAFPGWKRKRREPGIEKEVADIYKGVHASVSNLTPQIGRLVRRLRERDAKGDLEDNWIAMEQAERNREAILEDMAKNTVEFERARARYAGFGFGFLVFAVVSLALGWIGYRVAAIVVPLFGLSDALKVPLALVAFGCMAVGSLAAMLMATIGHWRAGKRGMEELQRESFAADGELAKRDDEARKITAEGMAADDAGRIRARRFRAWALLERLQTMIETEMSLPVARGRTAGEDDAASVVDAPKGAGSRGSVRKAFLRETRREFGPCPLPNNSEVRKLIGTQEEKWRQETFAELWRRLSAGDDRLAGHYPARRVVPELRRAVAGYVESVRKNLRTAAVEQAGTLRNEVETWAGDFDRSSIHHYASAALAGTNVTERTAIPPMVYYDRKAVRGNLADSFTGSQYGYYGRRASEGVEQTELLGLMYQEFRVEFSSDPETGNLTLQVVSDAG